ncbi:MAG: carboxypeptidase regulatory-like domain-containing protein [Myxococcota bacterium]
MIRYAPILLLLLPACTTAPQIRGTVVDIWGDPVEGAMVKLEGLPDRPVTDSNGRFFLPYTVGTHTIKAGRAGYIQEDVQIEVPEDKSAVETPVLQLFPIPEAKGFHAIGSSSYVRLEAKPIRALGNSIKSLYGLQEAGGASIDSETLQIVYHGDLRYDQLVGLDVTLHMLDFVETAELVSITTQEVPLNLYTAGEAIPMSLSRLRSRNDYLFTPTQELERGRVYALTTDNLLTPMDHESFQQIAPSLRLAFPIELR